MLAAALVVWIGGAGAASGHALILESMPRPDAAVPASFGSVALRFNSRIEKALSRIAIVSTDGRRLPLRMTANSAPDQLVAPVSALPPGAYTVEWKVLSVDGHVTRGSFRFRVVPAP